MTSATRRDLRGAATTFTYAAGRLLPGRADYTGLSRSWRHDVLAGITVGVVALPLALAFGVTSGLGAGAGLTTAIVAGLVAAVFGGSNVQVSGPTGAMTVVLLPVLASQGAGAVFAISVIAGVLVMAMGVARLGRAVAYIPWPVVAGFTLGIATIIGLQQVPLALDVPKPEGENTALIAARAVLEAGHTTSLLALALVLLVIALMVMLPRIRRTLPASLIAVIVATVLAELVEAPIARIGEIPSSLPAFALPDLSLPVVTSLMGSAVAIAFLAAIESLLSAKVSDGMSDTTKTDPDRELIGQGLANVASGVFGGMPATGAIARTAVNVRAGARTRISSVVHALVLVVVVLVGSELVATIPLAALAGVLIVTAGRMVDRVAIRSIFRTTRSDMIVFTLTALATVTFDLIVAVEVGIAVAAILALRQVARVSGAHAETLPVADGLDTEDEQSLMREHIAVYRIDGALFFGAAQRFLDELTDVADVRVVVLRLSGVRVVDATGANALAEIVTHLQLRGITVLLKGIPPRYLPIMRGAGVLNGLSHERHLFHDLDSALEHARDHVQRVPH
ncbi:SulP family inorganic anion transporter [Segeticoccus rhizosphaerae]|uniref:SulP family inorganic anion transporter n=1 Tax=Segeticoccus rhizosphaerae TaxID=1104777 RepID=UPI001EE3B01B|nr:SulP family inorganic anion transporter [Ornithinicoccus soli]